MHVLDDEDLLAGLDQAKLAAGDFLYRGGIFAKAARLFGEAGVVGALARQRRGQRGVLTANPQHRQQPAVARERVHHDDEPDQAEPDVQQAAIARLAAKRLRLSLNWLRGIRRRHVGTKVH